MKRIIFTLLIIVNIVNAQVNIPKNTKRIFSKDYIIYGKIEVVTDSTELQGFLIFEFIKNPQKGIYYIDDEMYTCDIFFTHSLEDFAHKQNVFNYSTGYLRYSDYRYFHNEEYGTKEYNEFLKFILIYQKFEFLKRSLNSDFETGNNLYYLNTSIFKGDSINFWFGCNEDSIFTIFNVSIPGAIVKYDMIYYNTDDEVIGDFEDYIFKYGFILQKQTAIIPTDRTHYFAIVKDSTMFENGFKKSSWVPPNLFNN